MGLVVGSILMFKVDTDYDNSSLRNVFSSLIAFSVCHIIIFWLSIIKML